MTLKKVVVLDRDGVINHDSDAFIKTPDEWLAIPGSLEAIARLNQAGYRVVVATNQSGIGRGLFDVSMLNQIHAKMHREAAAVGARIDAVFFCPHVSADDCTCRKPRAGMLEDIIARYQLGDAPVALVGDALRDLQAAACVNFTPWLVLTGKGRKTLTAGGLPERTRVVDDLRAFSLDFLASQPDG
ncbi:D-glycero-beta-D-manno-heptose 1,7-bisphosphate 7-phosphatase [Chitinasiproducens palmae]|uniref:D,D-heptose 1,7-bisphosphate phosphatase n=1 Tax=Chitinasiproducens palmae TaxID=1770053 RepID=A0A1H2PN53_9BURK|nr:D-glycero-beta-D-manno-heptose 1,7-bisphosphate 7-phosphatase [Chitinasiproducens palmae]SDV48099.1 D-alpha,beta-D-heptose 1,7-bisphosphate phosphatase [Chitinasiproducens palmae]